MQFNRGDVFFAKVPHEEDPNTKERHPILVWNDAKAFIISFPMTSKDKGSKGMEYSLIDWEYAGLEKPTWVRLGRMVHISLEDIQEKVGVLSEADLLGVINKLINGR